MCYYVTIGSDLALAELKQHENRTIRIQLASNPFFKQNMPDAVTYVNLTDGHCSCLIYCCEDKDDRKKRINQREEMLRNKYRKKGWKEPKIERVVKQQITDLEYKFELGSTSDRGIYKPVAELLHAILSNGSVLYVYTHMYSGNIHDEKLSLPESISIRAERLRDLIVDWLPEDTIVKVQK